MPIAPRSDTNRMYFAQLKPALRVLGIRAFRIDEIHHLENIDSRILKEIDKSDLMVADLTNERPSVYFEAGYGEKKGIPVVYTCRADHLTDRGLVNFRVHFDVRQRPIVAWTNAADRSFSKRLQQRVRAVSQGVLAQLMQDEQAAKDAATFNRLSPKKRVELMINTATNLAKRSGFIADRDREKHYTQNSHYLGYRAKANHVTTLFIWSAESFLKKEIKGLWTVWACMDLFSRKLAERYRPLRRKDCVVLVSRHPVPSNRVESLFTDFERIKESPYCLAWRQPSTQKGLYVLGGVQSKSDLVKRIHKVIDSIA